MTVIGIRNKGVHVKLDKETHVRFKMRLVKHGLSMQEAFAEFARLVGNDNLSANNMMERLIRERVKVELQEVGVTMSKRSHRKPRYVTDLDENGLYDLIAEVNNKADAASTGHEDEDDEVS